MARAKLVWLDLKTRAAIQVGLMEERRKTWPKNHAAQISRTREEVCWSSTPAEGKKREEKKEKEEKEKGIKGK